MSFKFVVTSMLMQCALVIATRFAQAEDVDVSEGLNAGPFASAQTYQDTVIDFGALAQGQYRGQKVPMPFGYEALVLGSTFRGQHSSGHATGKTAEAGPVVDRFGDGKTLFLQMTPDGLTYGKQEEWARYTGYGAKAKKTVSVETVLGHRPLAVVFPKPQYAFGIELKRLFRMKQHDGSGHNDRHIRVKAFGANGALVAERRYMIDSVFSASFVRCQYSQDITAIQITSNVDGGIALSKLTFDLSSQPPDTTRSAQKVLPFGFEFLPCNSLMG